MKKWQLENIVTGCDGEKLVLSARSFRPGKSISAARRALRDVPCENPGPFIRISRKVVGCLIRVF